MGKDLTYLVNRDVVLGALASRRNCYRAERDDHTTRSRD
jgi:hypothetical protein